MVIQIVAGAFGTVTKSLEKRRNWISVEDHRSIPSPVQNGSSSVQNGKIIISINIKNIL